VELHTRRSPRWNRMGGDQRGADLAHLKNGNGTRRAQRRSDAVGEEPMRFVALVNEVTNS
jgi:hypothetical protein